MSLNIKDAAHEPAYHTVEGHNIAVALFHLHADNESQPEAVTPIFFEKRDGEYVEIGRYSTIWNDVKEEIYPNYKDLGARISVVMNELAESLEGLTYEQLLARFLRESLEVVNGKLAVKGA